MIQLYESIRYHTCGQNLINFMDFFKKAAIGISTGILLLVLTGVGFIQMEKNYQTQFETITYDGSISIESRMVSYQPMLIAPYKTMDIFLSEEESADFEFTSVGGKWEEISPEGTNVQAEVRVKINEEWTEWIEVEEEEDNLEEVKYAMASTNPATSFQYRFIMYGDGIHTPIVNNPEWTFIKSGNTIQLAKAPTPSYSAVSSVSDATYLALNSGSSNIISRKSWGADEYYRYLSDNTEVPELIQLDAEYTEKYKDELGYAKVIEKDSLGNKYKWPLQYPQEVKKFVVHHTATTGNLDNPKQAIKDIYYYHTITRGWGDIGYNYIIDQKGLVYEGRYGGEGVIGAHSGPGNNGSIGIAVLGNYQESELPDVVIGSISSLIADKSNIHKIDPEGLSEFRGSLMPNIFGHKDIMNTTCPGAFLYDKMPVIRTLAQEGKVVQGKKKFVKEYDYIDHSQLFYVEMEPNKTKELTFKLENIGTIDWDSKTYLVVDKNPSFAGAVSFPGSGEVVKATMVESSVKSGDMGTFKLNVKSGAKNDVVYMNVAPMINGFAKSREYIVVPVVTEQANFKYKYVDGKFPGDSMNPGETFQAWVKLENTGNTTWSKSGQNTVLIGTDHERDRVSAFTRTTRIGALQEASVPPGGTGTFNISLTAPEKSGYYKEYFTPVVEGVTWMADSGMYFDTTVFGEEYDAEFLEVNASKEWERGGKYLVKIKIRNLGQKAWNSKNFTAVLIKESDLDVTDVHLLNDSVAPGEVGTLAMVTEVAPDEKLERKALLVKPKVDNVQLLSRPIYVRYKVVENTKPLLTSSSTTTPKLTNTTTTTTTIKTPTAPATGDIKTGSGAEGDIRVKLGFTGNPKITANGSFEIYSGTTLITTLSSGDIAGISLESGKYRLEAGGKSYLKTDKIRFIPKNAAILKIDNFNHQPAWNPDLNDNQYRGNLEVLDVDGVLTVINELPLESYLKGLGEVSNTEEYEKIKAIIVAARTYAKYYTDVADKFPGKPYDLDDNPEVSQKYLGYGLEKRAPNVSAAVLATKGQVVTYNDKLVKTPYFNQSDGSYTKSAESVWGWTTTPYLKAVSDSYCSGSTFLGHGVGMSGCGAKGMAEAGKNYVEILKHYYSGVEIMDLY